MNRGFLLYRLQTIDSQIDTLENRKEEIELVIKNDENILQAETAFNNLEKERKTEKNKLDAITDEIERKRIKREQSESKLYSGKVSNPKELEDLQEEIQSLKRIIKELEDKAFDQLVIFDEMEEKYKTAKDELKQAKAHYETNKSLLTSELNSIHNKKTGLIPKRDAVKSQVEKTDLEIYKKFREEKGGLAVTNIDGDSCAACGSILTPSQKQEARSAQILFFCPSCGRIIYGV